MRRLAVLSLLLLLPAPAALAHQPATVRIVRPVDGAVVDGGTADVELEGVGGRDPATFRLLLDGAAVDVNGHAPPRTLFTTHTVRPGGRVTVRVTLPRAGTHELRVVAETDADAPRADIVRRFRSTAAGGRGVPAAGVVAGLVALVALAAAVVLRRLTAGRAAAGLPGADPATAPAGSAPSP